MQQCSKKRKIAGLSCKNVEPDSTALTKWRCACCFCTVCVAVIVMRDIIVALVLWRSAEFTSKTVYTDGIATQIDLFIICLVSPASCLHQCSLNLHFHAEHWQCFKSREYDVLKQDYLVKSKTHICTCCVSNNQKWQIGRTSIHCIAFSHEMSIPKTCKLDLLSAWHLWTPHNILSDNLTTWRMVLIFIWPFSTYLTQRLVPFKEFLFPSW